MSDVAARPLFLPAFGLSWSRRLGLVVALGSLLYVWGALSLGRHRVDPQALLVAASLAASLVLANLNHAGAQIAARGLWWAQLAFGATLSWMGAGGARNETLLIVLGGGGALLMAGTAGLRADAPTRGAFAPVAFRRTLLASIALSVAEVQALGVASSGLLSSRDPLGVELGACALLIAAGLVGLYWLRFWGVLLHWMGTAFLALFAIKAVQDVDFGLVYVWCFGLVVQLLLPLPMLLAIVRRTPVTPPTRSVLAPRLFFGGVAALTLLSAGRVAGLPF